MRHPKGFYALLAVLLAFATAGRAFCGEPRHASDFDTHLSALKKCAERVGIQVVSLRNGNVLWEHHAKETFLPASLVKILTSYAALKHLGPHHKFRTEVLARAPIEGNTLSGDIWIRSEGDPFLLVEKAWTPAHRLKALGIHRILGGVYVDNSYFDPPVEPICLDDQCRRSYNPVLSATALDFNTVTLRAFPASRAGSPVQVEWSPPGDYIRVSNSAATAAKGSRTRLHIESLGLARDSREIFQISGRIPLGTAREYEYRFNIADPAVFVAHAFRALLREVGIGISGNAAGPGTPPPEAKPIATWESLPLGDMLYGLNRYSNNFMAEMVLRSMGGVVAGPPGSKAKGLKAVRESLGALGIPADEAILDSGSGLSRNCRVSPQAFCKVLLSSYLDFTIAPEFLASLATNNQDGTLKRRILQPGVTVRGKTGTLNDVAAFAGYIAAPETDTLAVTVILNDVQNISEAREAMDAFLLELPKIAKRARNS